MPEETIELSSPKAQTGPTSTESLYDFISSTPPAVTRLIVELRPVFKYARWLIQVVSWKSGAVTESWLVLGCWWLICVSLQFGLRFLFPVFVALPFAFKWAINTYPFLQNIFHCQVEVVTTDERTINATLSDITIIQSLLPRLPPLPTLNPTLTLLRVAGGLYVLYLAVVLLVPIHLVAAVVGTLCLTWRSPWAQASRKILRRSGALRWVVNRLWLLLSGIERAPNAKLTAEQLEERSLRSKVKFQDEVEPTETSLPVDVPPPAILHFKFTIMENQRWWMGLDWTAALLPGERPSWCTPSPALHPVPPPSVLSLPGPSTVFLPMSTGGPSGFKIKRTAKWRWEDNEWGVLVVKEGGSSAAVERIPIDLSKLDISDTTPSSAAKLADVVGKSLRRAQTVGETASPSKERPSSSSPARETSPSGNKRISHSHHEESGATDPDGWVYADNKWEAESPKAGIGKYTRHRRWTRVAVLEETVDIVPSTSPAAEAPGVSIDTKPDTMETSHSSFTLRQRSTHSPNGKVAT